MSENEFTLENRVLCSDDMCIGTIGPDGRCQTCGGEYRGDEPLPTMLPAGTPAPFDVAAEPAGPLHELESPIEAPPFDPDERICCPDDMCIGIIGENGQCGTCGKNQ